MSDYLSDPDFQKAPDEQRHGYLQSVDKDYASASSADQVRYLAHLRGPQAMSPENVPRNAFGVPKDWNDPRLSVEHIYSPSYREFATKKAGTAAMAATGGLSIPAGIGARALIAGAEPIVSGTGGWWDALKQGAMSAAVDSVLPGAGKLTRSAPGVEGMLTRNIAKETAAKQAASDAAYDTASTMVKGTADSQYKYAQGQWKQATTAAKQNAKDEGQRLLLEDAEQRSKPFVAQLSQKVPPAGIQNAKDAHDFAWGERSWKNIQGAMDEGQKNVVAHMKGQPVRMPELGEPGADVMSFPDAWKRVSEIPSRRAREEAMDGLRTEVGKRDPSGQALAVFDDLRKIYGTAVTMRGAARKAFPASGGGEYDPEGFINWWNGRREPLANRLRGDYEDVAGAAYGNTPRGSAYEPPRAPVPVLPTAPTRASVDIGARPQIAPSATVTPASTLLKLLFMGGGGAGAWFHHPGAAGALAFPNLLSRWKGQVPLKPDAMSRAGFGTLVHGGPQVQQEKQ